MRTKRIQTLRDTEFVERIIRSRPCQHMRYILLVLFMSGMKNANVYGERFEVARIGQVPS
jgi:hypothetical protein